MPEEEVKTIETETPTIEPTLKPASETVDEESTTEEKKSSGGFFSRFKKDDDWADSRDGWILTHLQQEDIMEYLRMEDEREKLYLEAKEKRNKRIMIGFLTTICLIAAVCVIYLLKDNPTILISILYIIGIIGFVRYWKK